jgi:L-alanine-DL-glutamate epimerase-like enolase superfamily enzyme
VLFPDSPYDAALLAERCLAAGFTAIKFGWGRFGSDESWDQQTLREIRRAVGDTVGLMVDAGRCWSAEEALRRAPRLFAEFGLLWLEEPLKAAIMARPTSCPAAQLHAVKRAV